jgi:aspartyl-tRNA(Asn)/glutamyl-tRNA(Gln) amidotransferase subunit C
MIISKDEVRYVAQLANLELREEEIAQFTSQLSNILEHMQALNEIATDQIEPMMCVVDMGDFSIHSTPTREDDPQPSMGTEKALSNAPDPGGNHFRVPKVIAER